MNRPLANSTRRAFTLVELLVVIVIIGGLIGLLIPVIGKVRRASQGAATQAQMVAIGTAIESYYSDFRAYPGPLPNGQLGGYSYSTVVDANITSLGSTTGTTTTYTPNGFGTTNQTHVTGSENLVLGLLGGLEYDTTNAAIAYNRNSIWPVGTTPAPKGAENLNPNQPKRFASYLQVKTGDISNGNFVDAAQRTCGDSIIPEFLDKSAQPMPILYLRANPGAQGVVTMAGADPDTGGGTGLTYQYELAQVLGYTSGSNGTAIGTTANNSARDHHGLQGTGTLETGGAFNPISTSAGGAYNAGSNAIAYLKDPNTPLNQPSGTANANATATARQKDGFLLISAGPDGVYGTSDDQIYPGSLNP